MAKKFKLINIAWILSLIISFSYTNSFAIEPEEILKNPNQELRARTISKNIRCMVCQNQSIDDSNAPLAKDLRILIREKIKKNYSDDEIYLFLTERYGDFILLKPPLNLNTYFLWFLPLIFFLIGVAVVINLNKKSKI
tara:strand:+ start:2924 stop:3337 length:414 start_codon:yes stop_codon:yes gene_type:complete